MCYSSWTAILTNLFYPCRAVPLRSYLKGSLTAQKRPFSSGLRVKFDEFSCIVWKLISRSVSCHPPFIKFSNNVRSEISAGSRSEDYIGRLSFLDHDGYRNYLFLLMHFLNKTVILSCSIVFSVYQIETELIRYTKQKLI